MQTIITIQQTQLNVEWNDTGDPDDRVEIVKIMPTKLDQDLFWILDTPLPIVERIEYQIRKEAGLI